MADDAPRTYADDEVADRLDADGPANWSLQDGHLTRAYKTDGWRTTLMLVNAIGYVCEAAFHHPDLAVGYNAVQVRLRTHSANGITDMDFAMAAKIEELALWRPGADSPLGGTPNDFVQGG
jgi:4a-hydroxytetrahydrobiopterin dehydratase